MSQDLLPATKRLALPSPSSPAAATAAAVPPLRSDPNKVPIESILHTIPQEAPQYLYAPDPNKQYHRPRA